MLSKLGFRPMTQLMKLPEYRAAGLHEWHSNEYFPSLSVNSVEDFLGLVQGATKELAEEIGTTEEKLSELYNAAMMAQMGSIAEGDVKEALKETYALGVELTAPPEEVRLEWEAEGPPPGQPPAPPAAELALTVFSLIDSCMPPIRDQGDRGTCVGFATVAVLEYLVCRARGVSQHLSEQYLYWNTKRTDRSPKEGTWLEFAFPLARRDGVCREDLWPYEPDLRPGDLTHGDPPNRTACDADAAGWRFARAVRLRDHRSAEAIKSQLREGRPVAVAIPVFKTWYANPTTRLSGKIILPLQSDRFAIGGHAIALVGYEDDDETPGGGYFLVRNSWGTTKWGKLSPVGPGYGTIPYAYIERLNADAWTGII